MQFAIFLLPLLLSSPALASWGEHYAGGQLSWVPVSTGDGFLHTPALGAAGGYFITDFSLLEGNLWYGATHGAGAFHQLAGADLSFRLLIDATEWVPSIGPMVGWQLGWSAPRGLEHGLYAGASGCVERRTAREYSLAVCGGIGVFPLDDWFQAVHFLGFRFNAYLPHVLE